MRSIHAALEGRLGQDVELRRSESGKDWARLSVGVVEGDHVTWVSSRSSRRIKVLGQIGGRPGRSKARRERAEADAFNDAIPF